MAIPAFNGTQHFDAIHFGGLEARCKVRARSASLGARDRSMQPNDEDLDDSGSGLRLVVRHTFLEIEEEGDLYGQGLWGNRLPGRERCVSSFAAFESTKMDDSDCDAASDSTAPPRKGVDATDFDSENGSASSPVARKWSDQTDATDATTAFGDIASDSASDCSEVDLLSCADIDDEADIKRAGPPGQHMPASPPGNFWPGWEGSSEVRWPVECYDKATYGGPPGFFFQNCSSGWDQCGPSEMDAEPKQNSEEIIGENDDQISQSIKSEGGDDSFASPSGGLWSKIASSSESWADMDDSMTSMKDWTTVMLKNLPQSFTRSRLRSFLDSQGFAAKYDFVYVPTAFRSGHCFGYAFVNLTTNHIAEEVIQKLRGFQSVDVEDVKTMEVCYSHPNQGLAANIDRYRNSPVMHDEVPEEHRPMLLKDGEPSEFPCPTKRIPAPRVRRTTETGDVACVKFLSDPLSWPFVGSALA